VISLDTHTLVWWVCTPAKLGRGAVRAIANADRLGVSAIVFWEVALLARKGKLRLGTTVAEWAVVVLSLPRVEALPITPEIAIAAEALAMHPDPADRLIVATAQHHGLPLVTKDDLIRSTELVATIW
jgi:PIN domain nuclease of toxin-antitoxin system